MIMNRQTNKFHCKIKSKEDIKMNEQLKTVETILGIKKELMKINVWHDYLIDSLNKANIEISLLEEELKKEIDSIKNDVTIPQATIDLMESNNGLQ